MPRYKRTRDEADLDFVEPAPAPEQQEKLRKLQNMWEFASLMQYIFLFGQVVKIDEDLDIEDLETECLQPEPSEKLAYIGLQLLKYVSSHRGLTCVMLLLSAMNPDDGGELIRGRLEIFAEYTRRQYLAKAPQRNPFGDDEEPTNFNDLDVFTRVKVLQQLSTWTFGNAERMRGLMPQDEDPLNWRMEPTGWDKEDRSYYVLDDNRLYRRSDEPLPPSTPLKVKARSHAKAKGSYPKGGRSRATRASKRRKVADTNDEMQEYDVPTIDDGDADDTTMIDDNTMQQDEASGYGFTPKTWECIAITLEDYQDFMATLFRSRDPNEKQLRSWLQDNVLPIIEKRAEALKQKQLKKIRELDNLQKMATAKRSSRLADKAEKTKQDREEREAEEKKKLELRMAHEEHEKQRRIEEGHESRRLTREQRVREREAKRILHEEELAKLENEGERIEPYEDNSSVADAKRASERQRRTRREQLQKDLQDLAEDDGSWYFDCSVCGKHGENMDDGTHSIACDRCNVWQHSKCHGFSPKQAESNDFTFVCHTCQRKEADAKKPKIPPLKLHSRTGTSPETSKSRPTTAETTSPSQSLPDHTRQLDPLPSQQFPRPSLGPFGRLTNGSSLSSHGQSQDSSASRNHTVGHFAPPSEHETWQRKPQYQSEQTAPVAEPPPQASNGYSPAYHYQQHHHNHHNAVESAGGHPNHHQQAAAQAAPANGHGFWPQAGVSTPQNYYLQHSPQNQQVSHHQHSQRQMAAHLPNGFYSPAKEMPKKLSASPPVQGHQHISTPGSSERQPWEHGRLLEHSPKAHLPPPAESYHQKPSQSPVKSSPVPQQHHPSPNHGLSPHSPTATLTPKIMQPPSMNAQHSNPLNSPHLARPGSANGKNIAADGMSGPWPRGSQAIPQKHDQSPAPPSTALSTGEKKILPMDSSLAPSPEQRAAAVAGSVPVKSSPPINAEGRDRPPQPSL